MRSVLLLMISALVTAGVAAATPPHDVQFWKSLQESGYAIPAGQSVGTLALEATDLLGSTDPQLRDGIAYETLATWIYQRPILSTAQLIAVRTRLQSNAVQGLGDTKGDSLFLRSFSILVLSVIAARDLKEPVLEPAAFDGLVELALHELAQERDLRGYVADKGWGHATAHCADLLKFLARSPRLSRPQQASIVAGIEARLHSADTVFVWGEDARLAAALAALARRADADPQPFAAWMARLAAAHKAVWSGDFDAVRYVRVRAQLNTLTQLTAELEAENGSGAIQNIREALRALRAATR